VSGIAPNEVTAALENALGVLEASHRILANNIANANTPDFIPTRVSFADSLRQAIANKAPSISLEVTNPRHIRLQPERPVLVSEPEASAESRTDQSKFDVDREMVELLKNSGKHNIFSSILQDRYQQIREVLRIP
jgi:flagellar basal-body rod protein FlgB